MKQQEIELIELENKRNHLAYLLRKPSAKINPVKTWDRIRDYNKQINKLRRELRKRQ